MFELVMIVGGVLVKPFYMWAGGKSKLIKHYEPVWVKLKPKLYVEPFFGGGAVYAWLKNSDRIDASLINDVNPELMGVLSAIKSDPHGFLGRVRNITETYLKIDGKEERKKYYYDLRKHYWKHPDEAILFCLMRLGFNGIWQTCKESQGMFATPAGLLTHTREQQIFDENNILQWSQALQNTTINSRSYEKLEFDPQDALIYLDPPYRDSFTTYGTGFNDDDQKQLADWALQQHKQGATILLANRCVENDSFFEDILHHEAQFHYFDVTYTAGRRKRTDNGFEAKKAREFLAVIQ